MKNLVVGMLLITSMLSSALAQEAWGRSRPPGTLRRVNFWSAQTASRFTCSRLIAKASAARPQQAFARVTALPRGLRY